MTSREYFSLFNKFRGLNLVGTDIACFYPPLDSPGQITALTCSELLLQYVARSSPIAIGMRGLRTQRAGLLLKRPGILDLVESVGSGWRVHLRVRIK